MDVRVSDLALTAIAAIKRVLNLNEVPHETGDGQHDAAATNGLISQSTPILNAEGEPIWKVLVFDNLGRDVISTVLRVNDLRSLGITIHLYVWQKAVVAAQLDAEK